MENGKSAKMKSWASFIISIIAICLSIAGFVLSQYNWQELEVIIQPNYAKHRSINSIELENSLRKDTIKKTNFLDTLNVNLFVSNNGTKREILRYCRVLYITKDQDTVQTNYSSSGMVGIPAYIEPKEASLVPISFPIDIWRLYQYGSPQRGSNSVKKVRLLLQLESYWYDLKLTKTSSWIDLEIDGKHGLMATLSSAELNKFE